jgi:hypothetical protein
MEHHLGYKSAARVPGWCNLNRALSGENMATKGLTFAVFRTSKLSLLQLADMLAKFDSWEQHNLGAATTSEGRLGLWDEMQNDGKLGATTEQPEGAASSRSRTVASKG